MKIALWNVLRRLFSKIQFIETQFIIEYVNILARANNKFCAGFFILKNFQKFLSST